MGNHKEAGVGFTQDSTKKGNKLESPIVLNVDLCRKFLRFGLKVLLVS